MNAFDGHIVIIDLTYPSFAFLLNITVRFDYEFRSVCIFVLSQEQSLI